MNPLPTLYATSSAGKIKQWKIIPIELDFNRAALCTIHGYKGGKLTTKNKPVKGKNIGRANETTPFEQACLEAESAWKKKLDKNYTEHIPISGEKPANLLPMLAHDYRKRAHDIVFPCYVQPKLNGVRCLAKKVSETEIDFTSRKNKSYNDVLQHLVEPLLDGLAVKDIPDGEIYRHGWTFQRILRAVKKFRPDDTPQLQYWVYDMADDKRAFSARKAYRDALPIGSDKIVCVNTYKAYNEMDIKKAHDCFIRDGYEGVIIRNNAGMYIFDHRSKDLQKYKEFIDEEFEIIGGQPDVNGGVVFEIANKYAPGTTFFVRPKGTDEDRLRWMAEINAIVNSKLTVRYQELSDNKVPVFPVGVAIRDYE